MVQLPGLSPSSGAEGEGLRRLGRSLGVALVIVVICVVIVGLDPFLLGVYRGFVPRSPILDAVAKAAVPLLEAPVVALFILTYIVLIREDRRRRLVVLAGAMASQALLIDILKSFFGRPRPADVADQVLFLGPFASEWRSFPGGHATAAFTLAAILASWHPRWRWAFYGWAALVALTRIHLDRHFPGDCFIGACVGYWIAQCFLVYLGGRGRPEGQSSGP